MSGATLRIVGRHGLVAAFALVTGVLFAMLASTQAFAITPHVPYTRDTSACAACHTTHTAVNTLLLRDGVVDDPVSSSCFGCHAGTEETATNVASGTEDSFGLRSGHSLGGQSQGTVSVDSCATCHEVHGASSEIRMIPAQIINGTEVATAGSELCLSCHDSSESWFGPDYPETSEPTRDATGYPVAGTWPGSDTYASSTNAHRLIPETTQTVGLSDPVRREQGSCLYCHSSHASANAYDGLRANYTVPVEATLEADQNDGTYAELCFSCHGGERPAGFDTTPVDIKQFATAEGTSTVGHRIVSAGSILPVGAPLPCFECHNPHGSELGNASLLSDERGAGLDTSDAQGVRSFCFTCHTTSDTAAGWSASEETSYTPVTSSDEVLGLRRDGGDSGDLNVLRLPEGDDDEHDQDGSESCYDCHGGSYAPDGNNVHNPESLDDDSFSAAEVLVIETVNVPQASVDLSPSIEPSSTLEAIESTESTESVEAVESVESTYSVDATQSADATQSTESTQSAEGSESWMSGLLSLSEELGTLLGLTEEPGT